jgi:hypothetical protein
MWKELFKCAPFVKGRKLTSASFFCSIWKAIKPKGEE